MKGGAFSAEDKNWIVAYRPSLPAWVILPLVFLRALRRKAFSRGLKTWVKDGSWRFLTPAGFRGRDFSPKAALTAYDPKDRVTPVSFPRP